MGGFRRVQMGERARQRERNMHRERERHRQRERERDCLLMVWSGLFMGAEIVSSTVMYNLGGGPRGDPLFLAF
jgi:hypothetical protein